MSIHVTLPDGSVQTLEPGAKPIDVARAISTRLADDAIVARVNGDLWDLNRPFEGDSSLQILTSKNPDALEVVRHSTAHLLAAAVLELFPETKLGIGPPIVLKDSVSRVALTLTRKGEPEVCGWTGSDMMLNPFPTHVPGNSPSRASSRKQMRQSANLRIKPRGRPHRSQRLC